MLNRAVEAAVIENGAEVILGEGLAYDRCSVGVITNIDPAGEDLSRWGDGCFDWVQTTMFLHELSGKALPQIIREGFRVLAPHGLMLHAGFPSLRRRWLGWHDIAAVDVRRGPMGWLTGGGTLAMRLSDGSRVVVADLAHPDHAAALIKAMAAASRRPAAEPLLSAA